MVQTKKMAIVIL